MCEKIGIIILILTFSQMVKSRIKMGGANLSRFYEYEERLHIGSENWEIKDLFADFLTID